MHWNFPACFLVTLLIISLVLVSVTVIIIFLSEVVARGSSSLPFKVQTTSGTGIPWNHSIYIRTVSSSLNTSYLTDSYIVFTLKMESVSKNTMFGLTRLRVNLRPRLDIFKINFSRPLFTIIFRPKIVFLGTDSILRVKTMYECKNQDVLMNKRSNIF